MAATNNSSLGRVIQELCRLPGIGARSAERIAMHLLEADNREVMELAEAIGNLKKSVRHCSICFNLAQGEICSICAEANRDRSIICVVELPKDVMRIEATGAYKGLYHVLGGHIAPLDGVGPDKLNIDALLGRARELGIKEVIIATNPTVEGDGTALHISSLLEGAGVKITRLARGLASGAVIEYASKDTIAEAITGRQPLL